MPSKDDITFGSIWMAADGGNYGLRVVSPIMPNGDVLVRDFNGIERTIDWFKLTYRYYPINPKKKEQ